MRPILLCAGMDAGRAMRTSMIALSLGIGYREIKKSEYPLPLCALLGDEKTGGIRPPALPVSGPMLVMAGFPDPLIDALLRALRENDLSQGVLKAVLTDTNRFWSCGQLYAELAKEAALFKRK